MTPWSRVQGVKPPCKGCESPRPCNRLACVHWIEYRNKVEAVSEKRRSEKPVVDYICEQNRKKKNTKRTETEE